MSRKPVPTFADYLVIAITPGLIMALLGSLVFFLLTAFYQGEFDGRLRYIAALFVFSAVLIGRIGINEGSEYASLFAIPLALATWLTLARFTDAGFLVIVLIIGITWWAANKLTWDCTVIDEAEEATAEGLLQAAGFRADPSEPVWDTPDTPDTPAIDAAEQSVESDTSRPFSLSAWWQSWVARRRQAHPPGVWVIYFAMATLPMFGFGQWAIPASDLAARHSAFHCLLVYVASALALLGTTSFLGIRRYLRQRKLTMPEEMAGSWAVGVALLILVVVLLASALPRPSPEASLSRLIASQRLDKSHRWWWLDDSNVEGDDVTSDGNPSSATAKSEKGAGNSSEGQTGKTSSSGGSAASSSSESTQNGSARSKESSPRSRPPAASRDEPPGNTARDAADQRSGAESDGDESANPTPAEEAPETAREAGSRQSNESGPENSDRGSGDQLADQHRPQRTLESSRQSPRPASGTMGSLLQRLVASLSQLFRWLYWVIVAVVVGYLLVRFGRQWWAAFLEFVRSLLGLFAAKGQPSSDDRHDPSSEERQWRPFASFRNPFSLEPPPGDSDLVRYMFQALEAWARERGCPRQEDMTPDEFARQISAKCPSVAEQARYLIGLYDRLAYAGNIGQTVNRRALQSLWRRMA